MWEKADNQLAKYNPKNSDAHEKVTLRSLH